MNREHFDVDGWERDLHQLGFYDWREAKVLARSLTGMDNVAIAAELNLTIQEVEESIHTANSKFEGAWNTVILMYAPGHMLENIDEYPELQSEVISKLEDGIGTESNHSESADS